MTQILAVIPARGGSKRTPRKNLRMVAGSPLIEWTIRCAQACPCLSRVVVSTDDPEIAATAIKAGAEVPFTRPPELATDEATTVDVTLHALHWFEEHEQYWPDWVVVLQPTSPLRSAEDISNALAMADRLAADSVISVRLLTHPLHWIKLMGPDRRLIEWNVEDVTPLSPPREIGPGLPGTTSLRAESTLVVPNGAVYVIRPEALRRHRSFYTARSYEYLMPQERSLDIDTEWDLYLADLLLRNRGQEVK